jgi:hypothetical protein
MAKLESRYQIMRMPWHANMTEKNHLGAALIAKPHVFESKMTKIFTAYRYSDNPLTSILVNQAREETIESDTWEWKLRGASTRPLIVMEVIEPAANTTVGKARQSFRISLDEPWFVPGDVIHPGASDKKYQCRVQEEPFRQGSGWVYTLKMMTDDFNDFIPATYLTRGTPWAKLYAQYEEGAEQSGSTQYSLPISLMNRMSRFRKKYEVTGDAAQEVLAVKIPDNKGNMYDSWIRYAEVEYWNQWYKEIERGNWYSRSTNTIIGKTGRPIYSGPGIQQQLEDGHIHYYSVLTARLIEEYLMDIFYSRIKPGTQREVMGFTGEYGMIQFHRAVQDWMSQKGFIQIVENTFISKTESPYNTNALQAGYQFTKYKMANGAVLTLIHNPLYDDREINFEIDPVTGFPVESQRITFLDFSGEGASSNIKLMNKRNSMKLGYVGGLQSPYGPVTGNKLMSHAGDYYTMHVQKQCGVHIEDVTRCGELKLSRN